MELKYILSSTWLIPVILFILSIFGLLSALLGDELWDLLSWFALGIPLMVILWALLKSAKQLK